MSYGGPQQQQYGDPGDYAQPSGQYGQPQQMWQQNQQPYGQAGAYPPQQGQYMQQPSAPPMHMQVRNAAGAHEETVCCNALAASLCTTYIDDLCNICRYVIQARSAIGVSKMSRPLIKPEFTRRGSSTHSMGSSSCPRAQVLA